MLNPLLKRALPLTVLSLGAVCAASAHAWEPTKPVEIVVPFSAGGATDQMARSIQGIITKHKLMKQAVIVQNKAGASGAEGLLDVKASAGDPHKLVASSSGLYTVPLATGLPVQLAGPDAGGDGRARPVRAVGQSARRRTRRRPSTWRPSRKRRTISRWAAPAPSAKTISSPR